MKEIESLLQTAKSGIADARTPECISFPPQMTLEGLLRGVEDNDRTFVEIISAEHITHLHSIFLLVHEFLRLEDLSRRFGSHAEIQAMLDRLLPQALPPASIFAESSPYAISRFVADPETRASYRFLPLAVFRIVDPLLKLKLAGPSVAVFLASFSSPGDSWSAELSGSAVGLLDQVCKGSELEELLRTMLEKHVKPAFAQPSVHLTEQARQRLGPNLKAKVPMDEEISRRPWKYRQVYIPTIFAFVVAKLSLVKPKFFELNWPLLVPPCLEMIEDTSTHCKSRGCEILNDFLDHCPAALLRRTGVGTIFEQALRPFLMHLPTLVSEEESLQLLSQTYPVLIKLANALFDQGDFAAPRTQALDRILRLGVLKGYAHAGENPRIATFLMLQVPPLVRALGRHFLKHLKRVLPMISLILSDPFGTSFLPLLSSALDALHAIVLAAWPCLLRYRGDVLHGLFICWLNLSDIDPEPEIASIKSRIRTVLEMMQTIDETDCMANDLRSLLAVEPRLEHLVLKPGERPSA